MSQINQKETMKQISMYIDIEISEKQIDEGQVKEARTALRETRLKYGLQIKCQGTCERVIKKDNE